MLFLSQWRLGNFENGSVFSIIENGDNQAIKLLKKTHTYPKIQDIFLQTRNTASEEQFLNICKLIHVQNLMKNVMPSSKFGFLPALVI